MRRKEILSIFVIIFFGVSVTLPVIINGFPDITSDSVSHVLWYSNFANQLWAGEFYPRWLIEQNGGLGSPVFFYYPPVAYYLTAIFHPFFSNQQYGWHEMGLASAMAMVASGLSAYLWLKSIASESVALVASLLYMAMPYHLGFDLYSRGAFAEYWTYVWMPLILYFTDGIIRSRKFAVVGLAISYALLIMTHLPTILIFSIVPICYAVFIADSKQRVKVLSFTACAMSLGVGLSAIYLLPAMTTQDFVRIRAQRPYYENYFLFTSLRISSGTLFNLTLLVINMVGLACCGLALSRTGSDKAIQKKSLLWFAVVMVYTVMTMPISTPVWRLIPILQAIQFPFRFNTVIALPVATILALGLTSLQKPYSTKVRAIVVIACLLVLGWVLPTAKIALNSFSVYRPESEAMRRREEIRKRGTNEAFEYQTQWAGAERGISNSMPKDENGNLVKARVIEGVGNVVVKSWGPREITIQVQAVEGVSILVSQFYYPGWNARFIEGESDSLTLQPSKNEGLLNIYIPSGTHQVLLQLEPSWQERTGQIISAFSTLVIIFLTGWFPFIRRRLSIPKGSELHLFAVEGKNIKGG